LEPRDVVQAAIDAYHAHDLDACLAFYAGDVTVRDAAGAILRRGADEVRASYADQIRRHPGLRYDIPNRIALGSLVVDEERVTGLAAPREHEVIRAVLAYRVEGGLIREIAILA
jgi:hypothetical protein